MSQSHPPALSKLRSGTRRRLAGMLGATFLAASVGLPVAAQAQNLVVSAAASLTNAFKEIGPQFQQAHPGVTVNFNFGASGALLQQISQGAPADVFASADQATMDRGEKQNLLEAGTRKNFVANSLVLITPAQDAQPITKLEQLQDAGITRIAIGKPATVPAGSYARQALEHARLWTALQPKFIHADNVRQVLDYVNRGEVDAGFVYRTDAAIMGDKVKIVLTAGGHKPITYPVAIVRDSRQKQLAARFIEYLDSAPAREVLNRYGFSKP